jgi:hypothetical protein
MVPSVRQLGRIVLYSNLEIITIKLVREYLMPNLMIVAIIVGKQDIGVEIALNHHKLTRLSFLDGSNVYSIN